MLFFSPYNYLALVNTTFQSIQIRHFGALYQPIKYSAMWGWLYRGDVRRAANRPRVIWKSRHRLHKYQLSERQWISALQNESCRIWQQDCTWRTHVDRKCRRDEQEDTHSPLLFGQKHPNWLTCQVPYIHPESWNHEPSNFTLLKINRWAVPVHF